MLNQKLVIRILVLLELSKLRQSRLICQKTQRAKDCQASQDLLECYPDINHPGNYKSCYDTCQNAILTGLIDCMVHCPGYVTAKCSSVSPSESPPDTKSQDVVDDAVDNTPISSPNPYNQEKGLSVGVIVAIVIGVIVILAIGALIYELKRRNNRPGNSESLALQRSSNAGTDEEQADNAGDPADSAAPTQTRPVTVVAFQETGNGNEDDERQTGQSVQAADRQRLLHM